MKVDISKLSQLHKFAKSLSQKLKAGDVVYLQGDLGSGKTTFTQMLIQSLGYKGVVKSPTYAIYEDYDLNDYSAVHMDLYRLSSPEELYYLAIDEIFDQNNIVIIEWPDKGLGVLPPPNIILSFELIDSENRVLVADITS
jgi:tRNA threonylcarbamoyladenosine biosynthesis protein TsaE